MSIKTVPYCPDFAPLWLFGCYYPSWNTASGTVVLKTVRSWKKLWQGSWISSRWMISTKPSRSSWSTTTSAWELKEPTLMYFDIKKYLFWKCLKTCGIHFVTHVELWQKSHRNLKRIPRSYNWWTKQSNVSNKFILQFCFVNLTRFLILYKFDACFFTAYHSLSGYLKPVNIFRL